VAVETAGEKYVASTHPLILPFPYNPHDSLRDHNKMTHKLIRILFQESAQSGNCVQGLLIRKT